MRLIVIAIMVAIPYESEFRVIGGEFGVAWWVMAGMCKATSNFNAHALHLNPNGTYDYGLMQVNERNASGCGLQPGDLFEPTRNIRCAASLLQKLYGRVDPLVFWEHDVRRFVMLANNMGWGNVGQRLTRGPRTWDDFVTAYPDWGAKYAWVEKMDGYAESYRPPLDRYKVHLAVGAALALGIGVWYL